MVAAVVVAVPVVVWVEELVMLAHVGFLSRKVAEEGLAEVAMLLEDLGSLLDYDCLTEIGRVALQ